MLDTTTEAGARAAARLREEEVAWLTTVRPDGQPQSVPVWFLWDGESFLIYSQPDRRKLSNIARNPRVHLNLNSDARGGDVVRVEGAAVDDDPRPRTRSPGTWRNTARPSPASATTPKASRGTIVWRSG